MSKANITVDARLFIACAKVQSSEEARYYLNGVYVQPHPEKGALLIATDGHRMMVAHDEDGECSTPAIVRLPKDALAFKFKEPHVEPKLSVDSDGIATLATFRSENSVIIDGTYPDWSAVVRPMLENAKKRFYGKEMLGAASFNGKYLSDFGSIAAFLKNEKTAPIRVVSHNEHDPAIILFPGRVNVFGVLMPMRTSVPGNAIPSFMKEVLEPSRKTKRRAA
jgi:DNA polymerase III sliding clamp (beta) subunit (PCNA family)